MKFSEQSFRSVGAMVGLLTAYFCSTTFGAREVAESAVIWATSCVVGGFIGQRLFRWAFK